ncbi:MAG: hypothetical protein HY549_11285 [Elusimicrobia bacterium]|nr:hypothetical protein [Elusimicrobiota bacterium]
MRIWGACLAILWAFPVLAGTPASVVESRQWKVISRERGKRIDELSGDVTYRAGPTLLKADWALKEEALSQWTLKGGIALERRLGSGDRLFAWGDAAAYNEATRAGSLTAKDRVKMRRSPALGEPDHGSAGRADWDDNTVTLSGAVHIWGPRLESWSDKADIVRGRSELILTGGRPVLRKIEGDWTGAIKADKITAWDGPRRMAADGKAVGWLRIPREASEPAR